MYKSYTDCLRADTQPSEPGSPEAIIYKSLRGNDGVIRLTPNGTVNIQDEINSYAQSVDIHTIVKRYMAGDPTALGSRQGIYTDISSVPSSFIGALQFVESMQADFERLPAEVKERFGNDFAQYIKTAGSDEWLNAVNPQPEQKEVKSDES